jgi:hypothetical protein
MFLPDFLLTAKHVHPNVNSAEDYRQRQWETIQRLMAAYPNIPHQGVHLASTKPEAFVSGGRWLVECDECGNCPVIEPEWGGIARCYECGAVYEGIELPVEAPEIVKLLILRNHPAYRYWNPHQTLDQLREENERLRERGGLVKGDDNGISS